MMAVFGSKFVDTYLLRVPRIARTPCTGTLRGPTRNVTSHKSGIARISLRLSQSAWELWKFTTSSLLSAGKRFTLLSRDVSCDSSEVNDSTSEMSVESYPEEYSRKKNILLVWVLLYGNFYKTLLKNLLIVHFF